MENGVATVMTSFSSWQGVKIAGHKGLVTDILKDRMNFGGFVVTDWNAHGQVAGCSNASCSVAVNAGIDMFMAPESWREREERKRAQVKEGMSKKAREEEAGWGGRRGKQRRGRGEEGKASAGDDEARDERVGAAEERGVGR